MRSHILSDYLAEIGRIRGTGQTGDYGTVFRARNALVAASPLLYGGQGTCRGGTASI